MAVERIDFTGTDMDDIFLDITDDEIVNIHNKIIKSYFTKLKKYGVIPPWDKKITQEDFRQDEEELTKKQIIAKMGAKELQLIFLCKYRHKLVHKDLISAFVRKHIPDAALDQQVRHLGTQNHWNVLNKGASIPDEDEKVPSAFHYLVSIDQPNPAVIYDELKRQGRVAAKDFDELKIAFDNCCATCGRKEGTEDNRFGNVPIVLQQGHMNPSKALDLENTIPQCQYCNQTYGDDFIFNEYGRIIAVYNPKVVLRSPKEIKKAILKELLAEKD